MMHSLFLKIFLCFWLTMALAGLVLVASDTRRMERTRQSWQRMTADAFGVYADSAADAHHDTQTWSAKEYLADLEERTGIRAWLFNARNREISGHATQARAAQLPFTQQRFRQLIDRARRTKQTEFDFLNGVTLAAREATSLRGDSAVLAGELPIARFGLRDAEPHLQGLRLLTILLVSGAVCWGLSHYLTRPIVTLRAATHRFSDGDLTARAGADLGRRRDEIAQLSRDFDQMAARIEELLDNQQQLLRAQRRLLGDVSHELRSPLARATVALELARDHLEANNQTALVDSLDRIERETARQNEMINRLLTMARLESGLVERGHDSIDLAALVRAVCADADYEARSHNRSVSVTRCDECHIFGTSELLQSALENVIRNAVRYTPPETQVQVSLRVLVDAPDSSWALVQVLDQGAGVPEEELEGIFRPFQRIDHARDRARGGAGLGLTIAARAVELHGGKMSACNTGEGGLRIEIRLPL